MHWTDLYQSKLTTADQAVKVIKSGDSVFMHMGCSEPEVLVQALMRRAPELRNVAMIHMRTLGNAEYTRPEYEGIFHHTGYFLGSNVREAIREGRADYVPIFLSEVEGLFNNGSVPVDVALMQGCTPDKNGYMSLATGVNVNFAALKVAKHIIFEVNDQAPRILGDSAVHISQAHQIVECSHPLPEYHCAEVTDTHREIGRLIANMIPDAATLQIGVGAVPEAVLKNLHSHKNLGVHSEMCSDGIIDLIEAGVVNNSKKTLHPRKTITAFVLGSKRLFQYVDNNPHFEFHPTSYVNDPFIIAQNDNLIALNAAIEVDLTGQVCSDSVGCTPYSGCGGQVDFIRGAARSKGGKPIISLPSTAKHGTCSRIVPILKGGAGVVTSRADVHYIVTEFGVAYLHGKSLRQRAEALIGIAHPKFRDDLTKQAEAMGLLGSAFMRSYPITSPV